MCRRSTVVAVLFLALGIAAPLLLVAAERYDVTPLPFLPFSNTGGEALSNNGVVAGGIVNSDGSVSLAEWHEGVLTNLGVPPGLPSHDFNRLRVLGINNSGTIVGTVHTSAGEMPSRSFIYNRSGFTVLPLVDPTDLRWRCSRHQQRRGGRVRPDFRSQRNRVAVANGAYSSLLVSGTNTAALGINSRGTIIGNRTLNIVQRLLAGQLCCAGKRGYVLSHGTTRVSDGVRLCDKRPGRSGWGLGLRWRCAGNCVQEWHRYRDPQFAQRCGRKKFVGKSHRLLPTCRVQPLTCPHMECKFGSIRPDTRRLSLCGGGCHQHDLSIRQLEARRVQFIIWSPRLESPTYPYAKFRAFLGRDYARILTFPDQDQVWERK